MRTLELMKPLQVYLRIARVLGLDRDFATAGFELVVH